MKKTILIIAVIFFGLSTQAQEKKKRNAKITFQVDGVCKMCKKRIEKASLNIRGVKYAKWDVAKKEFMAIIDERKTDEKAVQQTIANIGHDTEDFKAPQEAYDNLHGCCKYRDKKIINDHKKKE